MTSAIALPRTVPISQKWGALAVLMAGTFMIVLDFFIVNVALPSMQHDLHASTSAIEWVVAGYGLTFATCLITAGRIGDRIGRRRAFTIGLTLFTITSLACGLAPDATILIAARLLQGLAAALISPNVLAIIGVAYQGAERVRALTVYGMVMGFAAAGAQLIGGALVQADIAGAGWRTVFLINLPVGLAAILLAPGQLPESRTSRDGSQLDLFGTVFITTGLTALLLPLVEGHQEGFPEWTWLSLALSPIILAVFLIHQLRMSRRGGRPLLEPSLFRERSFSAGLVTQLAFWSGMASFFVVLALYLQQGRGLNALQAGLVFTILAMAYLVTSLRAPRLTLRYGRSLILVGALTLAAGYALLLVGVGMASGAGGLSWIFELAPGLLLAGAGMGLCITPLVAIVLASVQPEHAGAASGILSTVQQLGNALGVAVTGLVFFGALAQGGYSYAFELALAEFVVLLVCVAGLSRLLPRSVERTSQA
jgi:EmrB/QacA subfamily drug resistance transporter